MRRILIVTASVLLVGVLAIGVSPAMADKPQKEINGEMVYVGNGYPSGPHFNLNILGKWRTGPEMFDCPSEAEYLLETPDKNVIYVPRDEHRPISILVESGKQGPKDNPEALVLEVTDWCAKDFDGTDAAMRLPKDEYGYLAYARITGKPGLGKGEEFEGFSVDVGGCLQYAEDLTGNDMILLGLVTNNGTYVPNCVDGLPGDKISLERTSGSTGKGVKKAVPITDIFEFTGEACYIDETGLDKVFCCVDANDSQDDVYEHCDWLGSIGDGTLTECPEHFDGYINDELNSEWDYITVNTTCETFEDDWIFNIADFVGHMWDIDSTGAYNVKVRFYPCSEQSDNCGLAGN